MFFSGRSDDAFTYTLSLTHLMQVGPPSDDDNLGIAWIAQVCRQLPLSRPVPAHVEEYLDDDEDDDNSGDRGGGGGKQTPLGWCTERVYGVQVIVSLGRYSHVPVQLHFHGF